jgi:hypothetical protein
MKKSTQRLLEFAAGGGALGAFVVGGPVGILGGALLGGIAREVLARAKGDESAFGSDGVATIEEARYAKSQLKQQIFSRPDVPWWLVGVGIGGAPGNYYVLVSVSQESPDARSWIPKEIGGVPVVADATGVQPLEMSTGLGS